MTMTEQVFSDAESAYLRGARLGRLATSGADGSLQNNPVGFSLDPRTGVIVVFGRNLAATRKFRNVRHNPRVALVVDDVASVDPWVVRGVEIRGLAEALEGVPSPPRMSQAVIRIRPQRIISWGVDPPGGDMTARNVASTRSVPDVA